MPAHQIETMNSVRTLLTRIVDYAGLFPPAKLDMATTVKNYADFLSSEDSWMLERLIVPAKRLEDFLNCRMSLEPQVRGGPWNLSAIISSPGTSEFENDLKSIEAFNKTHGETTALIDVVEVRVESPSDIDIVLDQLSDDLYPYIEIPIDHDPRGLIAAIAGNSAGAKVRTGGVTSDLYPTSDDLARFIESCGSAGVPFKATAGLHHPLSHTNATLNVTEFGFLNLFLAACFSIGASISRDEVVAVLNEKSIDAFTFVTDRVSWNTVVLEDEDLQQARDAFATSFGSCSFDEPRQYLREAGIL